MGPEEGRGGPLCRRRRTGHEPSPCFQGPRPCTPAPPATTALEVTRATQESLSPARSTPSWQQKGARVWQRACPALLATSAHPQVRMLSPQGRVARLRGSPRRQVSLPLLCPGLSSFEDHPCPPGHWCPGGQGAFLCPPGTFRTEPGASSREDCEHCPPGYYCPGAEQSGRPSVLAVPCGAGSECPAGGTAALSPPGPAPASHLSPELWPGGRGASQGTAWPPVWPREPSAQSPKARPVWLGLVHLDSKTEGLSLFLSPQVLWLRPPAGLAPTAGPRLGSPRSAPEAMPAPPAPPPTLARGSCECHPSSCQS